MKKGTAALLTASRSLSTPHRPSLAADSGYGGYGDWQRGARVIVLQEGNMTATQTYVRLENGNVIDQGRLW
jgi:hypothetical protein